MATRQEIQTALDLIKFTNVSQDLFNDIVPVARGQRKKLIGNLGSGVFEDMSIDDIKTDVFRCMENIDGYHNTISAFLSDNNKRAMAINGLAVFGVLLDSINNDIAGMKSKSDRIKTLIVNASNQNDLKAIGDEIENDIPNLKLVRKG